MKSIIICLYDNKCNLYLWIFHRWVFKLRIQRVIPSNFFVARATLKNQADASLLLTSTLIILVVSNLLYWKLYLYVAIEIRLMQRQSIQFTKKGNPCNVACWIQLAPCSCETEENLHLTSSTFVFCSIVFSLFCKT